MSDESKLWSLVWILLPIPYADTEILGILGLDNLPGVDGIEYGELSGGQKLLLLLFLLVPYVPFLDREYFTLLGMDPFNTSSEASLDDPAFDRTKEMGSENAEGGLRGGARQRARQHADRMRPGIDREDMGAKAVDSVVGVGKTLLKLLPILVIIGLLGFTVSGFLTNSGYGALFSGMGSSFVGVDINEKVEDASTTVAQGFKTAQCFGNAACLREWQFNNTDRPGSEERGESYKLEVDGPNVNDGYPLDIAGREKSYSIPVDFNVYNPRNGLKGITARDTKFRINIEGFGREGDDAYCTTGWKDLTGAYAKQYAEDGTILPGGSAGSMEELENLNLTGCGLIQPGFHTSRSVTLQVSYDYSSQSTLSFEAISYKSADSRNLIPPENKESKTADTPVKTYVNLDTPVLWFQDNGNSQNFEVQMGWSTDEDLRYLVDPVETVLIDSQRTTHVDDSQCQLRSISENRYVLSADEKEYMRYQQTNSWWDEDNGPTPVTCTMKLEDPQVLNPSGETLRMRVDANYTVLLEEKNTGFVVENSMCGDADKNCPLLVTNSSNRDDYNGKLLDRCNPSLHPDAADGCDVMDQWDRVDITVANEDSIDDTIEKHEYAYEWSNLKQKLKEWSGGGIAIEEETALGISGEEIEKFKKGAGTAFVEYEDNGNSDVRYRELNFKACSPANMEKIRKEWGESQSIAEVERAMFINPEEVDCSSGGSLDQVGDWYGGEDPEKAESQCRNDGGIPVLQSGILRCWN